MCWVIASPGYRMGADGDESRGVQWEARLIRERFYRDLDAGLRQILPVVLPGCAGGHSGLVDSVRCDVLRGQRVHNCGCREPSAEADESVTGDRATTRPGAGGAAALVGLLHLLHPG